MIFLAKAKKVENSGRSELNQIRIPIHRTNKKKLKYMYSRHPNTEPLAVFGLYLMPVPTI
jgi:hypothetical protein